jgi:hypothetical protein
MAEALQGEVLVQLSSESNMHAFHRSKHLSIEGPDDLSNTQEDLYEREKQDYSSEPAGY